MGLRHSLLAALVLLAGCGGGEEGSTAAIGVEEGGLYVVDGELEERGNGVQPAWSPDGERLAYVRDGFVFVDDERIARGTRPQWTPDGRSLLVERGGLRIVEVESRAERLLARGSSGVLSPDGRAVAFVRSSALFTVPLAGGRPQRVAPVRGVFVALDWRSAGEIGLLSVDPASNAARIELTSENGRRRVAASDVGESFAFSPDGRRLAFTPALSSGLSIANADGSGVERHPLEDLGPGTPMSLRWSPDGRELAFVLGGQDELGANFVSVHVLDVESGETRRLARVAGLGADIAWRPQS